MYVFLWFSLTIISTIEATILTFAVFDITYLEITFLLVACYISGICYIILFLMMDCLILYTFILLSNKVEDKKLARITKSLRESYDTMSGLNE